MKHPQTAKYRTGVFLLTACILLGTGAALAWIGPASKKSAVLEKYNYWQFWLAILFTAGALSVFLVAAIHPERRRGVVFRLVAVWIGVVAGVILTESAAYLLPVRNQMDNPWYLSAGGGVTESDELPFARPPHLKWSGLSRGDLTGVAEEDPYARRITFETDWQGFRNSKDLKQADLITIGDSFTEAGNVPEEESFCTLLGRKLGVPARNLGRAGYGAGAELIVLKNYGLACHPKIVLWQIAESNDLEDAMRFSKWVAAGRPRFFDLNADRKWRRQKAWMQRSPTFRVFGWLRRHEPVSPWPGGMFQDRSGLERLVRFLDISPLDGSVRESLWLPYHWEALQEGVKLCRSNNIQLVFIMIPSKYRVLGPYTRMLDATIATPVSVSAAGRLNALGGLSEAWCDSLGVTFVDATDALEARAAKGELVYQAFDTHLSTTGHEVVAELLLETLKNLNRLTNNSGSASQQ